MDKGKKRRWILMSGIEYMYLAATGDLARDVPLWRRRRVASARLAVICMLLGQEKFEEFEAALRGRSDGPHYLLKH